MEQLSNTPNPQQESKARIPNKTLVNGLFKPVDKNATDKNATDKPDSNLHSDPTVRSGSLISFGYLFHKHDPYPMVIVTDVMPGHMIRGVNLNYLTFFLISQLIRSYGDKIFCSYKSIKLTHPMVVGMIINQQPNKSRQKGAFRTYKWEGVRQIKKFDSAFLLDVITMSRKFDVHQMKAMRDAVRDQIRQKVNAGTNEIAERQQLYTGQQSTAQQNQQNQYGAFPAVPTVGQTG